MRTTKVTRASERDNGLATFSLPSLSKVMKAYDPVENRYFSLRDLPTGTNVVVKVNGVRTVITVNRKGRTLATRALPRTVRMPSVGSPVSVEVNSLAIVI